MAFSFKPINLDSKPFIFWVENDSFEYQAFPQIAANMPLIFGYAVRGPPWQKGATHRTVIVTVAATSDMSKACHLHNQSIYLVD